MRFRLTNTQFNNQRVLIIMCSTRGADLYRAHRGFVTQRRSVDVPNRSYSDREGHFVRGGRGVTTGSGAVYEDNTEARTQKLMALLKQAARQEYATTQYDTVCISAPGQHMRRLWQALPTRVQKDIIMRIRGNYRQRGIRAIMPEISRRLNRRAERRLVKPHSREAAILLRRR